MKRPWDQPKFVQVILEILWLPSQPTRKSAWNTQKFLWIILAIFRSPAKLVRKKAPGTTTVPTGYFGNLMVTITTGTKISLGHVQFLWIILVIFRSPTKSVFAVEILWSPSQPI